MLKIFSTLVIFLMLFGCKSTKELEIRKAKHISEIKLINNVVENQLDFNTLFVKRFDGSVEFDGSKFTFKGAMYMVRDSQIVLSIMPLMGIELFKVLVTPNRVVVIDKTKKKVYEGDVNYLSNKFNINFGFSALQSILSNRVDGLGCGEDLVNCLKDYKYDVNKESYQLTSQSERRLRQLGIPRNIVQINVIPEIFRLGSLSVKDLSRNGELMVKYDNFTNFDGVVYPKLISMEGNSNGKAVKFSMDIDLLEKDTKNGLGFKVPEKYEKVNIK